MNQDEERCLYCEEPITPEDDAHPINGGTALIHRECLIRMTAGSVGHQLRRCSCYGGDEEDPPGATRREGAREAAALYLVNQSLGATRGKGH